MLLLWVVLVVRACCRTYYLAAVEELWDYGPSGMDLIRNVSLDTDEHAAVFCRREDDRIGRVYTKARYVEYTDGTFTTRRPVAPEWVHLGLLGPPLRVIVGEDLVVVFRNLATHPYSFYPHGVEYTKENEGASYGNADTRPGASVAPGEEFTYHFRVPEKAGPGPGDPSSIAWMYHSFVDMPVDVSSGLVGPLLVTAAGSERGSDNLMPTDVDREFVTLYSVSDENLSGYIDGNMQTMPNYNESTAETLKEDPDFHESNLMHHINFYVYGNLPSVVMTAGERVRWYVMSVGSEVDLHTAHWHAEKVWHTDLHRTDVLEIMPGNMRTVDMLPDNVGKWMFHCHTNDHITAGMMALMEVLPCTTQCPPPEPVSNVTRTYYIAVEEDVWDFAPTGHDATHGTPFNEEQNVFVERGPDRIGAQYNKSLYREYTDDTFTTRVPQDPKWQHLGFLGPVVRAEVGDEVTIVFHNKGSRPYSLHVHGLHYEKPSEGTPYADGWPENEPKGDSVDPGDTFIYNYTVPRKAGPADTDPSSIVWLYHSHVDEVADTNSGLIGAILVTRRGAGRSVEDPTPTDVDREFIVMFSVTDENESWLLDANMAGYIPNFDPDTADDLKEDPDFVESNLMHGMNGYVYGNLPGLDMVLGERVRWYLLAMGTEVDLHTAHWHGEKVEWKGRQTDVMPLLPASMSTTDMVPTSEGTWMFHCHVNDHITAGMISLMHVNPHGGTPSTPPPITGSLRQYFVAIVEIPWDYAPTGINGISGVALEDDPEAPTFTERGPHRIGRVYKKAVYREYTDNTFMTAADREKEWEHLGSMGPIIRAEVGDEVRVTVKNFASRPYTFHVHGLHYEKSSEGTHYADGTPSVIGNEGIPTGSVYVYNYTVPEEAGPARLDGSSVVWLYHSHVDEPKDTNSGLIGGIIVTRQGSARGASDLKPTDVDREFLSVYVIVDENDSWYLDENMRDYIPSFDNSTADDLKEDEDFQESNTMHTINGYVYGNLPGLTMTQGERVRWYLIGMGSELDIHTAHWHGEEVVDRSQVDDVVDLIPATMKTVDMVADNVGTWMYHCHVHDHILAGMTAVFTIREAVPPIPPPDDGGISGGVIAAIVVGGVVLVLVGAFFAYKHFGTRTTYRDLDEV